jgi:hypothetical protein
VSPVKCELGFYSTEYGVLHSKGIFVPSLSIPLDHVLLDNTCHTFYLLGRNGPRKTGRYVASAVLEYRTVKQGSVFN